MQTAWKSDSYFKILRFYVFKKVAKESRHFEINIKTETQFTNVIFIM